MKVFVAGATGVLGQPSVRALLAAGHEVRGAARGEDKAQLLRSLGAEPVSVDLFDPSGVKAAVAGSEAVLHLATKIPPIMRVRSRGAWRENDRLRTEASRILADAAIAAGAQVFVLESITFVYADGGDQWLDENAPISLGWEVLESMMDGEREAQRFTDSGGRGVALRFGAFYAPYAQSTVDTARLARRRWLPVPGKGDNYVSSIHVDDAATAVVAALNAPAGAYNVVDEEPVTMRDYGLAVSGALGAKPPRRVPGWLFRLIGGGPAKYLLSSQRVSNRRIKEATGWSPKYPSVREGWKAIAEELQANQV